MVVGWSCNGAGELKLDASRQRSMAHERWLIPTMTVPPAAAARSRRGRGDELAMGAMLRGIATICARLPGQGALWRASDAPPAVDGTGRRLSGSQLLVANKYNDQTGATTSP
jgi:hypothetical protein